MYWVDQQPYHLFITAGKLKRYLECSQLQCLPRQTIPLTRATWTRYWGPWYSLCCRHAESRDKHCLKGIWRSSCSTMCPLSEWVRRPEALFLQWYMPKSNQKQRITTLISREHVQTDESVWQHPISPIIPWKSILNKRIIDLRRLPPLIAASHSCVTNRSVQLQDTP